MTLRREQTAEIIQSESPRQVRTSEIAEQGLIATQYRARGTIKHQASQVSPGDQALILRSSNKQFNFRFNCSALINFIVLNVRSQIERRFNLIQYPF